MKVVAVNGSPHAEKGNTAMLLAPFLEGMQGAGAEVELFHTKRLTIHPCQGEFHCWFRTPGECMQEDDMATLLPKLAEADVLVLATPLYVDGVSGPMKNLLDRMLPAIEPVLELREDHCRHPARRGPRDGKLVLVSNCGFWEMDSFDPLVAHVRAVCRNMGREFAGALLRPHGPALRAMQEQGLPVGGVLDAAREAGAQLARDGRIAPETLEKVGRTLLPRALYVMLANQHIRKALDEAREGPHGA